MATSRTLLEPTLFNTKQVTSHDWVTYPILPFKDAPRVTAIVIDRKDQLSKRAGRDSSLTDGQRNRQRVLRRNRSGVITRRLDAMAAD